MISEQYWTLLRRWFLLIIAFAVIGAVSAPWILPRVLGSTSAASSFESSAPMVVGNYVSPNGLVLPGGLEKDDDPVANYATSLALYSATEQYYAGVQNALADQEIVLSRGAIENRLTVVANPVLYRIDLTAKGDTEAAARTLARTASDVLIARAQAEADRASLILIATIDEEQALYVERLAVLEASPSIRALATELELDVIRAELKDLTWERERLFFNRTAPLGLVGPIETVETEQSSVSTQELLVLGAALGLVLGWLAANAGEHFRPSTRTVAAREIEILQAESADRRLPRLTERARELERRALALESGPPTLLGRAPPPGSS